MDWLKLCTEAGDAASKAINEVFRTEKSREKLGRGAGGDKTMHLDDVAEKAAMQVFEATGDSFILVSEEFGKKQVGSDPQYVVVMDPVDGSTNAKLGFPHFAISLGIADMGQTLENTQFGYVRNLIDNTTYHAARGGGAFKNGEPIKAAQRNELRYLAIAMPPANRNFDHYSRLFDGTRYMRALGSCSLDVCGTAEGLFDVYYTCTMRIIDFIAAKLIAEEAGCIATDFEGNPLNTLKTDLDVATSLLCASNSDTHKIALQKIRGV